MRVAQRIKISVEQSKDEVFLRREFTRFGSVAQVTRALGQLITEGQLVRLGVGIYAKAKRSALSGKVMGISWGASAAWILYSVVAGASA